MPKAKAMKLTNLLLFLLVVACGTAETSDIEVIKLKRNTVDSIISASDTVVVEHPNGEVYDVMETYYRNGSPMATRLLRDSLGNVRTIITLREGHYLQSRNYYANGQLEGKLSYSVPGILDGPATYFYEDGRISAKGTYKESNRWGKWSNYDENGRLVSIDYYDERGNIVKTEKP